MKADKLGLVIVEDSDVVIKRLRNIVADIEKVNCLGVASNYEDAVKMITELRPKVVLLDINLTGKNGIDVLREVKPKFPEMVVIMLTNFSGSYYRETCMQLGADHFLDKSSEFENIAEILKLM